eukprot:evm.model.scf_1207.7 EVM.evm.TU.scf_1207.7   scf_1207:38573-45062(-)
MALASAEDAPDHVGKTAPGNEPNIGSVGDGVATYGYGFPGSCADSACGDEDELSAFDCNICLCTAENPVVTLCGHLYCWPCIYRWSRIPWGGHQCPVCKAALDRRQVIPIYARGKGPPPDGRKAGDGDAVVAGQMRPAPAAGGGLSSILGCILCPFGPPDPDLEEGEDEQGQSLFLSRVLLALGLRPGGARLIVVAPIGAQAAQEEDVALRSADELVGEDAAAFSFEDQTLRSWGAFTGVLVVVMGALYVTWINPDTGVGDDFVRLLSSWLNKPELVMVGLLALFAVAHSGLAGLRPYGEKVIGARGYRVLFGVVSLPLAVVTVVYFINHRYQGSQLWMLQDVPGIRQLVWVLSFVSFLFLYPSTFNLLEVAAVDKPKLHLWESGVMRITRHPQALGQAIWCLAHTIWIGNSFMCITSLGLLAHHAFGCWHGDRRLRDKYGEAFEAVKSRTSIIPFQAIVEGRQKLPPDYYKEFLRLPYLIVAALPIGAYIVHPLMFKGSFGLGW